MESSEFQVRPARFREWLDQNQRSGSAPLRLVYIPTHRDCLEVLRGHLIRNDPVCLGREIFLCSRSHTFGV